MGSRVLLLLIHSDDGDGFKVNWSQSINSSHESRERDFHSAPVLSPRLLSVLQHFPAKALREEPGLIDSDILFPILFSYLFHTLKVFPPLHSRSSEKPNRFWLHYLDNYNICGSLHILFHVKQFASLWIAWWPILWKFTFAWVANSNKMAFATTWVHAKLHWPFHRANCRVLACAPVLHPLR